MGKDLLRSLELVNIFEDTRAKSNGRYREFTSRLTRYDTCVYKPAYKFSWEEEVQNKIDSGKYPVVTFTTDGSVEASYRESSDFGRVTAVLNFADALVPGGRVTTGSSCQEEGICRCTNVYESLIEQKCLRGYYAVNKRAKNKIYTNAIVYSRNAIIFKDGATYNNVKPVYVDVITCPAPYCDLEVTTAYKLYLERISAIVKSAIENQAETLVLGAWGCGAFHQNPIVVSRAFAQVLNVYGCAFKHIIFAIKKNPVLGDDDNYDIFLNTLKKYYRGEVYEENTR